MLVSVLTSLQVILLIIFICMIAHVINRCLIIYTIRVKILNIILHLTVVCCDYNNKSTMHGLLVPTIKLKNLTSKANFHV